MKFEIRRFGIVVIPETDEDKAYIEDTLGLRGEGDAVHLQRRNAHGLNSIAYLETISGEDYERTVLRHAKARGKE